MKAEADSNDIIELPHDCMSRPYMCPVCDNRYGTSTQIVADRYRIYTLVNTNALPSN